MTSTNQKRIQELEAELTDVRAKQSQRLEDEKQRNQVLTLTLQSIVRDGDALSGEECQEIAKDGLVITDAEAQMQQRDLNIAFHTIARLRFPTNVRKQWSGDEVQQWIAQYAEILKERAKAHYEDKLAKKETLQ